MQWIVLLPYENEIFNPISELATNKKSENTQEASNFYSIGRMYYIPFSSSSTFVSLISIVIFCSFCRILDFVFIFHEQTFVEILFVEWLCGHTYEKASLYLRVQCACVDRYGCILYGRQNGQALAIPSWKANKPYQQHNDEKQTKYSQLANHPANVL